MTARRENRSRSLARPFGAARACSLAGVFPPHPHAPTLPPIGAPMRRAVGLPCTVGAEFRFAPYGPPGAQSRQRLRACRWCQPPRLRLVARRRAVRGPPPFATLYNGPQAARRWRGLPGARGAARARPRVALVCAALGPPRRNTRRGVPKPSKVCEKNAARRVQRAAPAPWAARPVGPLAAFSPAGLSAAIPSRLGCWWWSWAVLASLPRRRGPLHENAGGGRGSPAPGLLLPRAFSPARFFSPAPCILAGGPAFSPSPWLSLVVPALCMAARRGRAAPPLRAAMVYRRCRGWGERTGAGETAQGSPTARPGAGSVRYQLRY